RFHLPVGNGKASPAPVDGLLRHTLRALVRLGGRPGLRARVEAVLETQREAGGAEEIWLEDHGVRQVALSSLHGPQVVAKKALCELALAALRGDRAARARLEGAEPEPPSARWARRMERGPAVLAQDRVHALTQRTVEGVRTPVLWSLDARTGRTVFLVELGAE